ncbi:hypothetical protein KTT_05710 [Tengunoibacter tsumagoiensis]|uniref:Uncharacterized protein n=1 Tax=Tengunoibacter tsumagoiensis TaxID=2014871 RepID=A0A401ZV83_9CHLR|nr:hypothetical protein KTT_05710 [Tengunoibacter tsumagoiensis]
MLNPQRLVLQHSDGSVTQESPPQLLHIYTHVDKLSTFSELSTIHESYPHFYVDNYVDNFFVNSRQDRD